jgi:plastocyanin
MDEGPRETRDLESLMTAARVTRSGFTLLLSASLASAAPAAPMSVVRGTVTGKGLKTNAGMVVSLEAPALKLTPPPEPVRIDQKAFLFVPHVVAIVAGATVRFLNNDPEPHNVYSPEGRYNLGTWPPGETRDHTFTRSGVYSQLCNIHTDMLAFVVVLDTPFFAVTDSSGQFRIAGVPAGRYRLVVWSEKLDGLERDVSVEGGRPLSLDLLVEK